jgi:hypothetical protein
MGQIYAQTVKIALEKFKSFVLEFNYNMSLNMLENQVKSQILD